MEEGGREEVEGKSGTYNKLYNCIRYSEIHSKLTIQVFNALNSQSPRHPWMLGSAMRLHASCCSAAVHMQVVGLRRARHGGPPRRVAKSVSADPLSLTVAGQPGGYRPRQRPPNRP